MSAHPNHPAATGLDQLPGSILDWPMLDRTSLMAWLYALQGGPMTAAEAAAFEALPHARDAVAVRRWDDQAKDPAVIPPRFGHFAPLLEALARS